MGGVNNESNPTNNEPTSIEDALLSLRQSNKQASGSSMGNGGVEENEPDGTGNAEDITAQGEAQGSQRDLVDGDNNGSNADDNQTGGFADTGTEPEGSDEIDQIKSDNDTAIDYGSVGRSYIESTQRLAIDAANKLFNENSISKVSINDLYEKDDRGRVSFNNPDDPDRPFQSRAEAQQWCDAFNSQVDSEWKRTVQEYQQGYMKDIQPMLRLMDFAPEFDAMSEQEQKVFDNVVDGYSIKDSSGMIIGYSCDLRQAKSVALKICKDMGVNAQSDQSMNSGSSSDEVGALQGGGPAIDAKTSSTGNPQNDVSDPKNIEEAMKLIKNSKKKEKK